MAPFVPPPDFNPVTDTLYHYVPTRWVCLMFMVLFGISTFLHFIQALYFRIWWLLPTVVLAGSGEILGWSARYWSSFNDGILTAPYKIQIISTIISPTPLLGAYFIIVGRLVVLLGPKYSRLRPQLYNKIFLTTDITALFIQASGGGSSESATISSAIMLGGIGFQLVSLIIFSLLTIEYFYRFIKDKPIREVSETAMANPGSYNRLSTKRGPRLPRLVIPLLYGMSFSLLCLFIRAVYRLVELSGGWNGRVISTQVYFNVLDGLMIALAILTLNVLHPGPALRPNAF